MFIFKQVMCGKDLFSIVLTPDKKSGIVVTSDKEVAARFCKEYGMKLAEQGMFVVANTETYDHLFMLCSSLIRRLTVMSELNCISYHGEDVNKVKQQFYLNPGLEIIIDGYRFYTDNEKSPFKTPRRLPMFKNNGLTKL